MNKFLLILFTAFLVIPNAFGALSEVDRSEVLFKNELKELNPGFENGTGKWTASGGTFTTVTSGANYMGIGKANATWDASAANQTLTSPSITISNGLAGTNGLWRCKVVNLSGATTTMGTWDGTTLANTITIDPGTTPKYVEIAAPFGAASSTTSIRFTAIASNEPLVSIDDCYIGPDFNLSSAQPITDWTSYTPTFSAGWGTVTNINVKWRRVGSHMEIKGYWTAGTVANSACTVSLPSGVTIDNEVSNKRPAGIVVSSAATTTRDVLIVGGGTVMEFANTNNTPSNNFTPQTCSSVFNTSENNSFVGLSIPIANWSAASAIRADQSNFGWTDGGTIGLTSTGGGVVKGTTSIDKIRYRRNGQNLDVHIEYKQSGTGTAGSGDYLFAIPSVCTADTSLVSTFTTVNDTRGWLAIPGSSVFYGNGSNVGVGTVSLFDSSHVRIGGTTNAGASVLPVGQPFFPTSDSAIFYSINYSIPCTQYTENQHVPLLVGSVTSNTTGLERVERATITNNGTTCAVSSQSGTWISSLARNGADHTCTATIATGMFSSAPTCVCTCNGSGLSRFCAIGSDGNTSATSYDFQCNSTSTAVDATIYVQCMGPR